MNFLKNLKADEEGITTVELILILVENYLSPYSL